MYAKKYTVNPIRAKLFTADFRPSAYHSNYVLPPRTLCFLLNVEALGLRFPHHTFPHLIGQLRQRCCRVLHRPMRNGMRGPFGLCGPTLVATERLEKQIRDVAHRYQAEKSAEQPHDLQRIVPDLVEKQTPINRNPLRHCAL